MNAKKHNIRIYIAYREADPFEHDFIVPQRYSSAKYCISMGAESHELSRALVVFWDQETRIQTRAEFTREFPEYEKIFAFPFTSLLNGKILVPNSFEWFIRNREPLADIYEKASWCAVC